MATAIDSLSLKDQRATYRDLQRLRKADDISKSRRCVRCRFCQPHKYKGNGVPGRSGREKIRQSDCSPKDADVMEHVYDYESLCCCQRPGWTVHKARADDARSSFELGDVLLVIAKPAQRQGRDFLGDFVLLSPGQSFIDDFDKMSISTYGDDIDWELISTMNEDEDL